MPDEIGYPLPGVSAMPLANRLTALVDDGKLIVQSSPYSLQCYHREAWEIETNAGTEFVDYSLVRLDQDTLPDDDDECNEIMQGIFADYLEGSEVYSANRVSHWVAQWFWPGYLDQGEEYIGESESECLEAYIDSESCYDDGDMQDTAFDAFQRLAELADSGDKSALKPLQFHLPELFAE